MNEQAFDKENVTNDQPDNLTQENQKAEDILAQELNSDDSVPGTQHLDDNVDDDSELDKVKAELEEAKDKYLRLVAEFDN